MVIVIDSFHPQVFEECLKKGKTPALAFLARHGHVSSVISTFPTMTPTASATIATGTHCDKHHIPGFIWYDDINSYYVNYGASLHALLAFGPQKAFTDLFYNLNDSQLNKQTSTIYEDLAEQGIASACINFFIRRGKRNFSPEYHWLMKIFRAFGLKKHEISGPDLLIWGEIVNEEVSMAKKLPRGIFNKFGVNDLYTGEMVSHLIRINKLPPFALIFFPDNDRYSHVYGPLASHPSIQKVDTSIGNILSAFGSWEKALQECHFLIIGDHAQSQIERNKIIRLDELLAKFKPSPRKLFFGKKPRVVVSANERMSFINILDENLELNTIIDYLTKHKNIGLIMWKDNDVYRVISDGQEIRFWRDGDYTDRNGLKWGYKGDLKTIAAHKEGYNIYFTSYPDAFERIAAALDYGSSRKILLSAEEGWEYYMPGAPIHPGGGSHGSLHKVDSEVPLISAGLGMSFESKRTLDIRKHILGFFAS